MTIPAAARQAVYNTAVSHRRAIAAQTYGLDGKRNQAWCEYGYKSTLTLADYRMAWERSGIASGAVELVLGKVWSTMPWVIEGDTAEEGTPLTPWESQLADWLTDNPEHYPALEVADRMRMLGGYSYLILRIADGKQLDQPVKLVNSPQAITELVPVWSDQVKKVNDGSRTLYQYSPPNEPAIMIHPDRIIATADKRYAKPFLRAGFNALVNLEKIEGGSGESFLKNAARQLHINFDKDADLRAIADAHNVDVGELNEIYNQVAEEINIGNDTVLITQSGTVAPLTSGAQDPRPSYEVNMQTFCASVDLPSKILVGNQTGERASTEDLKQFAARCQSDRVRLVSPMIRRLVTRLIELKIIAPPPKGRFSVMWDDLTAPSRVERFEIAERMARIDQITVMDGGVFGRDRILTEVGMDVDDE